MRSIRLNGPRVGVTEGEIIDKDYRKLYERMLSTSGPWSEVVWFYALRETPHDEAHALALQYREGEPWPLDP